MKNTCKDLNLIEKIKIIVNVLNVKNQIYGWLMNCACHVSRNFKMDCLFNKKN
jgi:hypothetical protein